LGDGILTLKDKKVISATHWGEIDKAFKEILCFLDYDKPLLKLTSPEPTQLIVINESSLRVQGEVYKEYLPADTELLINITRQEDGIRLPEQRSFLKPSDLWQPNDPESPVAEFDEIINFPGTGTYNVTLKARNPAGLESEVVEFTVKVLTPGAGIIIHAHNPEGKEIEAILKDKLAPPFLSITAYNSQGDDIGIEPVDSLENHNKPTSLPAGTYTIEARFNWAIKEQVVTLNPNEIKTITFTFDRVDLGPQLLTGGMVFTAQDFQYWIIQVKDSYNAWLRNNSHPPPDDGLWIGHLLDNSIPIYITTDYLTGEYVEIEIRENGYLDGFHCSSVPYDLDGSAP